MVLLLIPVTFVYIQPQPEDAHNSWEWHSADRQQGNRDLSPTTTWQWLLLSWMSLEADFSPEPPDMSPGWPYLDLSLVGLLWSRGPSWVHRGFWPPKLLDSKRILFQATKSVVSCYGSNRKQIQWHSVNISQLNFAGFTTAPCPIFDPRDILILIYSPLLFPEHTYVR